MTIPPAASHANHSKSPSSASQRRVWSSLSMAVEHTSASTSTLPILPPVASASSNKADSHPPTYEASQATDVGALRRVDLVQPGSIADSLAECRVRTWKFQIAFEGGTRVVNAPSFGTQFLSCIKMFFGVVAASIVGIGGMILSVSIVMLSYVAPSVQSKPPQKQLVKPKPTRSSSNHSSIDSVATTVAASEPPLPASPPSPTKQELQYPKSSASSVASASVLPPLKQRVTFQLEAHRTGSSEATALSAIGMLSINTPTVEEFTEEPATLTESEKIAEACVNRKEPVPTRSFMHKLMRRRTTTSSEACSEDVELVASTPSTSAPSTPCTSVCNLPSVADKSSAADDAKRPRKLSLNLKLRGFKRRSATPQPSPSPSILAAPPVVESILISPPVTAETMEEFGVIEPPMSSPPTSKKKKRFSLPHNAPSTSPVSHPNTRPGRTNPYGAPHFATPPQPVERVSLDSRSPMAKSLPKDRRASFDVTAQRTVSADSSPAAAFRHNPNKKNRSNSKPPVTPNSSRLVDRHTRMQQAASAYYSDSELASPGSSPTRMRF